MTYLKIPYLSRHELSAIFAKTQQEEGCILYRRDDQPRNNPNVIVLRGRHYTVTRVVWAETYSMNQAAEHELETHEVVHLAECPHAGGQRADGTYNKLCINPAHLKLGDHVEAAVNRFARQARAKQGAIYV